MKNAKLVTLVLQPTDESVHENLRPERRQGLQDRRKLNTYIADDRRSGIANRRRRLSISLVFDGSFYSEVVKMATSPNPITG